MGMHSEAFEEQDSLVSQLRASEGEAQPDTSEGQQECAGSEGSMNSGYGSLSTAELSPAQPGCTEQRPRPAGLHGDPHSSQNKTELSAKITEENRALGRSDLVFPAGFEHKADEDQRGKKPSKSLTSWAQKLKQTQPKRVTADEVFVNSMQENERMKTLPLENTNLTDAALPPYTFYLNQPKESPNSIVSEASGLSYWKLDEKEMYHTLPENFRSDLPDVFSTKVSPVQLSSADEMKLSSLKDIYHKRQRENKQMPDQSFMPPSQPSHPPEILTLDPTLHMKPGQQNQNCFFNSSEDSTPFSPDSMAEPGFPSHCDTDSFSQTSHSSQLDDSPTQPASSRAVHLDLWRNHPLQSENRASSPFPGAYRDANSDHSVNTEEEETLTLTPSSVTQCADNSLPDYSLSVASVEDPVVMSKIRQNLREKHARHIADLRAYYDSEIQSLKQQLESSHRTAASQDLKKINQSLADRCEQLDAALNEASARIKALENKNNLLEKQVADWRDRFYSVSDNSKALQERLEEMRTSHKEKDNTISRLRSRLRELEEACEKLSYKLTDNTNTRLQEENKMFQNLLGEYESLGKEHERVKDTLNTTENKLLDANTEISDLKRTILKLEAQLKQVEHENALKLRHISENRLRTSCANKLGTPDVSRRKWLIPGAEYSIFTGQPLEGQESPKDNRLEETYIPSRHNSPPEKDSSQEDSSTNTTEKKENEMSEAPIIKAFRELEEGKIFKDWGTQTEKEDAPAKPSTRRQTVGFVETSLVANRSPEKGRDQHRPKRFSSPSGQRSSSLPPANRKSNTPTRREIMLAPVSVTYSPKRSPKENLSPGFSHLLSRNENTVTRFDILLDDLETGATSTLQHNNPRKRLQFHSLDDVEGRQHSGVRHSSCTESVSNGMKKAAAWEERSQRYEAEPSACEEDFKYTARITTLAETERLFDELTHEKQQIEAALSRIPCSGGRMTLQARLNQEALEDRLERINRDLGLIRMTLKRFHVLRTSANL
ncbi:M-phase phosphoprotein 9 isoform X2 [Catharus ustulatus]|nr:M-phase phosphoprotein 9 isoform X2 [Catharus ustulatus]XP_032931587.1 M-phase phosphoprotein 9 isoform X2 [Catharus ustulatus]XP_032931588.1 M-phase phosphoprotein 9 isoform X2 [Catharus ustulatus]XP_032931589.1 M-phase phosphoprotein 9 isoform X2 [Catharus ustulatus]